MKGMREHRVLMSRFLGSETNIQKLTANYFDADHTRSQGIMRQLNHELGVRKKFYNQLNKLRSAPRRFSPKCFVFTSLSAYMLQLLNPENYATLPQNRYSGTELGEWRPFKESESVAKILMSSTEGASIEIEAVYLDQQITAELRNRIKNDKDHALVIVDLLALNDDMRDELQKLDNDAPQRIIYPKCGTILKNTDLENIFHENSKRLFRTRIDSDMYPIVPALEKSGEQSFRQILARQIEQIETLVRSINTQLNSPPLLNIGV